jgi:CheY-like chemotaxis protein
MQDRIKALLVDDEPDIVTLLKMSFELFGYDVEEAENGEKCLEMLKLGSRPDVIIMDVMMPGMSGYDVCKRIKRDPDLKKIKVVMLTAKGMPDDIDEGMTSGADGYIIKPCDPYEIREKIKAIMSKP